MNFLRISVLGGFGCAWNLPRIMMQNYYDRGRWIVIAGLDDQFRVHREVTIAYRRWKQLVKAYYGGVPYPYRSLAEMFPEIDVVTLPGNWIEISWAAEEGSVDVLPELTGEIGVYNGVILHESNEKKDIISQSTVETLPGGTTRIATSRGTVLIGVEARKKAFGE